MKRIYKLFSNAAAFTAALDFRADGRIVSVYWTGFLSVAAATNVFRAELSFSSSGSFTVSDTVNSVSMLTKAANGAAAGALEFNQIHEVEGVEYGAGERIFMINSETGALVGRECTCYIVCEEGASKRSGVRDARGRFLGA
jgi:hypothetical protein